MRLVVFLLAAASRLLRFARRGRARQANAAIVRLRMITPFTPSYLNASWRRLAATRRTGDHRDRQPGGNSSQHAQMLGTVDWPRPWRISPARTGAHGLRRPRLRADFHGPTAIGDAGGLSPDGESAFRYVPEKERTHVVRTIRTCARGCLAAG